MPRTGRGGARSGKPGAAYTNRTDLNQNRSLPVATVPGQAYGEAGKQEAAQQAVPMASGPPAPQAQQTQGPSTPTAPPQPSVYAGELGGLDRPSSRPGEPVTQGLPIGAGAGPEVLPNAALNNVGIQLRALYSKMPNQDLRDLIEAFDDNRTVLGNG